MCVPSEAADKLLPPLLDLLAGRAAVHATAASLPHLVWDAGRPIDAQRLQRLARLCTRTGLRLMLVGGAPPEAIADGFLSMPAA